MVPRVESTECDMLQVEEILLVRVPAHHSLHTQNKYVFSTVCTMLYLHTQKCQAESGHRYLK